MPDMNSAMTASTPARVRVGCCLTGSALTRCGRDLAVVELQDTFFSQPRGATLRRWRTLVGPRCWVVIRAWQLVTHDPAQGFRRLVDTKVDPARCGLLRDTPEVAAALEQTLMTAEGVGAQAIVFDTPASFTPTAENRQRLARLFGSLERRASLIWQPLGLWSRVDVVRLCDDLGLVPGLYPQLGSEPELPNGPTYLRLSESRYSDDHLERLAAAAATANETTFVFNSPNMLRDAHRLRALLSLSTNGE